MYNAAFQNINENQYKNCHVQNCMKKVTDSRQTFPILLSMILLPMSGYMYYVAPR